MSHQRKTDAEVEIGLPIKIDTTSNDEVPPLALSAEMILARELAWERADENARRLGKSRRDFLTTAAGAATTLLAVNEAYAHQAGAARYAIDPEMQFDEARAASVLEGEEFIFDVHTHHVNPERADPDGFLGLPGTRCGESNPLECLSSKHYVEEIFLNSDTTMAVLTHVPSTPGGEPLPMEDAVATRALVELTVGSPRLQIHAQVAPTHEADGLEERMIQLAEEHDIKAFKTYTHFGGWWLDDPIGIRFLEAARAAGVKNIAVHKGISQNDFFATCRDVGPAAVMFPDLNFLIYHSGFERGVDEGPFRPDNLWGTDVLIRSLQEAGVAPGSNVYADLGTTWRRIAEPVVGGHVLGKLLNHVGQDNVLWGTDSIWYGSPQDQIQSFRAFEISQEFQDLYGYPALTPELKTKIFGLNASRVYEVDPELIPSQTAGDAIADFQAANPVRRPTHRTYGPRTRRDFLRLLEQTGGEPA